MKENYFNQRINCNVCECAYYDEAEEKCTLGSITVSKDDKQTFCQEYKNELE